MVQEKNEIILRQSIRLKIWKYVKIYGIHKSLDREKALEEIITLGWQKFNELEATNNDL